MSEFDLIRNWFTWDNPPAEVRVSVGDDAAVLTPIHSTELVVSVDTLVNGVHFPTDTPAHAIGHKALAVNLSDLAAMGATPRWFTLALTLPEADPVWLEGFAQGLRGLAEEHGIFLIGGDTTRGSLSITIQVMGTAPTGQALLRQGAQAGDLLCVSGTLGDAAAGLAVVQNRWHTTAEAATFCTQRLNYPTPRTRLGLWLRGRASSCMDISDGLLADLKHLLARSHVGASIQHQQLPFSAALHDLTLEQRLTYALTGGDDYELLFTIPVGLSSQIDDFNKNNQEKITVIGTITAHPGQVQLDCPLNFLTDGYNHFK